MPSVMNGMNMSKRVLYITTRLFWPPDSGRKVTLYHYCRGMHEQLGYEVHVFSFLEGDQSPEMAVSKPDFIESVQTAVPVTSATKVANILMSIPKREAPLQCCLFRSAENVGSIREAVKRENPDVVILDMVRLAPYADDLRDLPCAIIINFDDLLSKRYRRQIGGTGGNVLGKYGASVSSMLNTVANSSLKNIVLGIETRRVECAEARYAMKADASLFVSPLEARELDSRIGEHKCFSAAMGVDAGPLVERDSLKPYDFGFVGNMYTAANQDSLRLIVEDVLPRTSGNHLRVIGVCPDEESCAYDGNSRVSFTGRVESISEHLGQCKVLLAPFAYGSGVKTKVLEAMGMGVPVVTNTLGLEGISAEVGQDVLCADDPEGLAREAMRLIDDEGFRSRVAENGYKYVMSAHTWGKSISDLGRCIEYAIEKRGEANARA